MTLLIHNTSRENAQLILKHRRINANIEAYRAYNHRSGPFFYVEGQDGTEVPSGGERNEIDLYFECTLPEVDLGRAEVVRAIESGNYDHLRGKVVIGRNDISKTVEQAIIIPDARECLSLLRVAPPRTPGLLGRLLKRTEDTRPFDVLLPTTA